jgi:GNAT superfamily N-acetyltransferase
MAARRKRTAAERNPRKLSARINRFVEAEHPRGSGGKFRDKAEKKKRQASPRQRAITEVNANEGVPAGRRARGTFVLGDDDVFRRVDTPRRAATPRTRPATRPSTLTTPPKVAPKPPPKAAPVPPRAAPKAPVAPKAAARPLAASLAEHGPSKARIVHDGNVDYIHKTAHQVFGKKVSSQDIASAVGAPDDSHVRISDVGRFGVRVNIEGNGYYAERTIHKTTDGKVAISNEVFVVEESHQGKGIATRVIGRQIEQASKLGVSTIHIHAAGSKNDPKWNGYSTWPKFGYDGDINDDVKIAVRSGRIPKPPGDDPKRVSDLMKSEAGRKWWDNYGSAQDMEFDLTEGSYSRRVWDAYRSRKKR